MTAPNNATYRPNDDWVRISAEAGSASAMVEIYDEIGVWGTDAASFSRSIKDLDVEELEVRINSTGGDAFAGITIMNLLKDHPATVTVIVDGIAASAASVIAMGGDRIVMNRGSQLMIHEASGLCYGNAEDMRKTINALDVVSDSIADVYAARAGGTRAEWRDVMRAEQWYRAEEAVEAGLADEIQGEEPAPVASSRFKIFNYAGRDNAPDPWIPTKTDAPPAEAGLSKESTTKEESLMSNSLISELYNRLGLTDPLEDVTEPVILAALDEALAEVPVAEEPALPEGVIPVEAEVLDQLKADAEAGREALEAHKVAERSAIVEAAIKEGKVAPARRDHWLAALEADKDGTVEVLASLAPGLIPSAPVGVTDSPDTVLSDEDVLYSNLFPTISEEN